MVFSTLITSFVVSCLTVSNSLIIIFTLLNENFHSIFRASTFSIMLQAHPSNRLPNLSHNLFVLPLMKHWLISSSSRHDQSQFHRQPELNTLQRPVSSNHFSLKPLQVKISASFRRLLQGLPFHQVKAQLRDLLYHAM